MAAWFLRLLVIGNAGGHLSSQGFGANFRRPTAFLVWEIPGTTAGAETLSHRLDLRHPSGDARMQRHSIARFSSRERLRDALCRGRPHRYLVATPRNLLAAAA